MVEIPSAPGYLRLAEQLKQYIRSQDLRVGDLLPSRRDLQKLFDESAGIVRQAIDKLKAEGIVVGQQGRGGYPIAKIPGEPDPVTADHTVLRQLVVALRGEVRNLAEEVAELRREVRGPAA